MSELSIQDASEASKIQTKLGEKFEQTMLMIQDLRDIVRFSERFIRINMSETAWKEWQKGVAPFLKER